MLKELCRSEIKTLLEEKTVAHICYFDGIMPCMAAVRYVYDERYILAYSLLGKKMENIPSNKDICFQVDNIREQESNWAEICIWGKYKLLTDPAGIKASIRNLGRLNGFDAEAFAPKLKAHQPSRHRKQNDPVLFRIDIQHITGYNYKDGESEVAEMPALEDKDKVFPFPNPAMKGQKPPLSSAG